MARWLCAQRKKSGPVHCSCPSFTCISHISSFGMMHIVSFSQCPYPVPICLLEAGNRKPGTSRAEPDAEGVGVAMARCSTPKGSI